MVGAEFRINRKRKPSESGRFQLTKHAGIRINGRAISKEAVEAVLTFGRVVYTRGAKIFAIGRKEVAQYARDGVRLDDYDGIQIVCSPCGSIITAYRNHNFKGLRN